MEAQLQELIDKIQAEGVKEAERKAAAIIENAESKAAALVANAKREAEKITSEAERQAREMEERGREALRQAARDLILTLRETIRRAFDTLLRRDVKAALEGPLLEELIRTVVASWASDKRMLEIKLPPASIDRLKASLAAAFAEDIRKGVVLKPVPAIDAGFRIGEKDGTVEYDITDAGLAEMIAAYVNPHIAALINEALPPLAAAKPSKKTGTSGADKQQA